MDTFTTDRISAQNDNPRHESAFASRVPFNVKLRRTLRRNYSDSTFNLPRMARDMHLSERQLQRRLKDELGESPVSYLRHFRLDMATRFLSDGATIAEAAYSVGFTSQSYFAACFKAQFGTTATEFKRSWH